jgi:hypothetical protein
MTVLDHEHQVKASPLNRLKENLTSPFGKRKGVQKVSADDQQDNDDSNSNQIPTLKLVDSDDTNDSSTASVFTTTSTLSKSKKRALRRQRAKKRRQERNKTPTTQCYKINTTNASDDAAKKQKKKNKKRTEAKKNVATTVRTGSNHVATSINCKTELPTQPVVEDLMEDIAGVEVSFVSKDDDYYNNNNNKVVEAVTLEKTLPQIQVDIYTDSDADEMISPYVFGKQTNSKKENCECNACVIS